MLGWTGTGGLVPLGTAPYRDREARTARDRSVPGQGGSGRSGPLGPGVGPPRAGSRPLPLVRPESVLV